MSRSKEKEKSKIVFDQKLAPFILKTFDAMFVRQCIYCESKITNDNLAGVIPGGFICNNIVCLIKYTESIK